MSARDQPHLRCRVWGDSLGWGIKEAGKLCYKKFELATKTVNGNNAANWMARGCSEWLE